MRIIIATFMTAISLAALPSCPTEPGPAGKSCTVAENDDGSATITCEDGTEATIRPGENAIDPVAALVGVNDAALADCPGGGIVVSVGLDNGDGGGTASNGLLEPGEVDSMKTLCSGENGQAALVTTAEASAEECPAGGTSVEVGLDNGDGGGTAGNDLLEPGEVDSTETICSGPEGLDGTSCSVEYHCTGTATVSCEDGTEVSWETGRRCTVSVGNAHSCSLRANGAVVCWGSSARPQALSPAGVFQSLVAGTHHNCGTLVDDTIACWGDDDHGKATPPEGFFASVSAGGEHSCGLKLDGSVLCWGDNTEGQLDVPSGTYTHVVAGFENTCVQTDDLQIHCYGAGYGASPYPPYVPEGEWQSFDVHKDHGCGIRPDKSLVCWGTGTASEPPPGQFLDVAVHDNYSCAIDVNGFIHCWGDDEPVTGVPEGRFISIDTGYHHACGVRIDGGIECWGGSFPEAIDVPEELL